MQDHADSAQHSLRVLNPRRNLGRALGRLAVSYLAGVTLLALLAASARPPTPALFAEFRRSGVAGLATASLLLALAGLAATWLMAAARAGTADPGAESDREVGRAARWPQLLAVVPLAAAAMACAWLLRPRPLPLAAPASAAHLLAGGAIVLGFPLLVAERWIAALPRSGLSEAADLRALVLLPALAFPAAGVLELAATLGIALAVPLGAALAAVLGAVAVELAARALGRAFLPPPEPDLARAAVRSTLARIVASGIRPRGGIAAPIRQHLGIDFSRSWALAYVRSAFLPLALALLVVAWGLSGVVLVPLDQRAVYERLGAPVAVLRPGLHAILPWPLGFARMVEFGAVHETGLLESAGGSERTGAEDPAPPSADRLWKQAHPGELTFLIAGRSSGAQSFQTVSADLRVLYRVGLTDEGALRATYSAAEPAALVRAAAARVAAGFFAGETIDSVLGADREAVAERLRNRLQAALDPFASGIELVAVVIEAIHPPAGAAAAYHGVQAAEIAASASISAERGRALALRAAAAQHAAEIVNEARIAAADATGGAHTDLTRFTADREAARVGGQAFLLERYLANVTAALGRAPLTIVDSRITSAGGSVLDLRPPSAAALRGAGTGTE